MTSLLGMRCEPRNATGNEKCDSLIGSSARVSLGTVCITRCRRQRHREQILGSVGDNNGQNVAKSRECALSSWNDAARLPQRTCRVVNTWNGVPLKTRVMAMHPLAHERWCDGSHPSSVFWRRTTTPDRYKTQRCSGEAQAVPGSGVRGDGDGE